jgi:hypothetical protein
MTADTATGTTVTDATITVAVGMTATGAMTGAIAGTGIAKGTADTTGTGVVAEMKNMAVGTMPLPRVDLGTTTRPLSLSPCEATTTTLHRHLGATGLLAMIAAVGTTAVEEVEEEGSPLPLVRPRLKAPSRSRAA